MGLFQYKTYLNELNINGKQVDDNGELTDEENPQPEGNADTQDQNNNDNQEIEEPDDTEPTDYTQDNGEDETDNNNTNDNNQEPEEPDDTEPTDYNLPDDDENQEPDDTEPTDYNLPDDDENQEPDEPDDTEPTDYTQDNGEDETDNNNTNDNNQEPEEPDDTEPTDYTQDNGEDETDNTNDNNQELEDGDGIDPELKKAEDKLFSELSPEQRSIKNKELKNKFIDIFKTTSYILSRFNNIPKTSFNNKSVIFVISKLNKLKDMVFDYISDTYMVKTYIENSIMLQEYLLVLNTVNNIIHELGINIDEKNKKNK